ncbi:MAG: hypothetical protein KY468_10185 [Armatimonadetes bacterium]|nr:hypothetical protein [Armatimonadota bacterium]
MRIHPTRYGRTPEAQYFYTKAAIAHEAGHVRFSRAYSPLEVNGALHAVWNALEDERVERAMARVFWPNAEYFQRLGDYMAATSIEEHGRSWEWELRLDSEGLDVVQPGLHLNALLLHRWDAFHGFAHPENVRLWAAICPLAEAAWVAKDSDEVLDYSKRILEILGVSASQTIVLVIPNGLGEIFKGARRLDKADPLPPGNVIVIAPGTSSGWKKDQAELGEALGDVKDQYGGCGASQLEELADPAPYIEQARPLKEALVAALRTEKVREHRVYDRKHGRFDMREYRRGSKECKVSRLERGQVGPDMAVELCIDRSGSMSGIMEATKVAGMGIHLALEEVGIPHGISVFEGTETEEGDVPFRLLKIGERPGLTKNWLAGIDATTGTTTRSTLDSFTPDLRARKERLKVVFLLHDGGPSDGQKFREWIAENEGRFYIVGVYLDDDGSAYLQELFQNHLVVCPPEQLGERLAALLTSLYNKTRRRR